MSQGASAPMTPPSMESGPAAATAARWSTAPTRACAANAQASATSSSTQPIPNATRAPAAAPASLAATNSVVSHVTTAAAAISRRRPISAFADLAKDLEAEGTLGAVALGLNVLPLELEAAGVAVEGLLERGNQHAGQAGLERAADTGRQLVLPRLGGRLGAGPARRTAAAPGGGVGNAEDRVDDAQPGNVHRVIMPVFRQRRRAGRPRVSVSLENSSGTALACR